MMMQYRIKKPQSGWLWCSGNTEACGAFITSSILLDQRLSYGGEKSLEANKNYVACKVPSGVAMV
jgi:hypothetical protein